MATVDYEDEREACQAAYMQEQADKHEIRRKLKTLRQQINEYNFQYRIGGQTITDVAFDRLTRDLKGLEKEYPHLITPDSPTQRVGTEPLSGLERRKHTVPMLSIENTYSFESLREFCNGIDAQLKSPKYVVELKIDGCAVTLIYKDGVLDHALTRGDGEYGDDITENVTTIPSVPLRLSKPYKGILEVRGEIYITQTGLRRLNQTLKTPYKNTRNATAGAIRLLDSRECAKRPLMFFAHTLARDEQEMFACQSGFLEKDSGNPACNRLGLPLAPDSVCLESVDDVIVYCESLYSDGSDVLACLDFDTDGLVVKVNHFEDRNAIGATSAHPKWEIALKVEKYEAVTTLKDVTWQVGKTGVLTPVAELEPVEIAGTIVSRSTLHNVTEIKRLGISINDKVVVEKAGKIIPHVVRVEETDKGAIPITVPSVCPVCRSPVEAGITQTATDTEFFFCTNAKCPAQVVGRILHYCSRDCVDIRGIGETLAAQLVNKYLVVDLADLYTLTPNALLKADRVGKKSAAKLIEAIAEKKSPPLDKFLHGLSITSVGDGTSKRLAKRFGALEAVERASLSDLLSVEDIGEITATDIFNFFRNPYWTDDLKPNLFNAGVYPVWEEPMKSTNDKLAGKTFVVTGTLEKYDRKGIESLIEQHGGKTSGSVSKNTSFLVAGEKAGSKLDKAKSLGVPVISEQEFEKMLV
jgi:DNA ligase (NAD+)